MAINTGPFQFEGKIGNTVFRKDGTVCKTPAPFEITSPVTLKNIGEFSLANKATSLLYDSLNPHTEGGKDRYSYSRLVSKMLTILRKDADIQGVEKTIIDHELTHLKGFNFNIKSTSNSSIYNAAITTFNDQNTSLSIDLAFQGQSPFISAPAGATHYKLIGITTEVDFKTGEAITKRRESQSISLTTKTEQNTNLEIPITPNTPYPIITTLGIKFYQIVNNIPYPFQNTNYNSFQIIDIKTNQ